MPIVMMLSNKIVVGILGLLVLLNISISGKNNVNVKIYNHSDNLFYGDLIINNHKLPMIIEIEEYSEKTINQNIDKNIDKKEEYSEDKVEERVIDNKTPGSIKIKIKNEKGQEIIYERNMGSGVISEFDQKCIDKIVDSLSNYINGSKGKGISQGVKNTIKGFTDYCSKDKKGKWFKS